MAKNTKHATLIFIENKQVIFYEDLMAKFNITNSGARSYLLVLINQGIVKKDGSGRYKLTPEGEKRLDWFNENGCSSKQCSKCMLLRSENVVKCPSCQELFDKNDLYIQSESDFVWDSNEEGVYCPKCNELIFTSEEAKKLGIKWEE